MAGRMMSIYILGTTGTTPLGALVVGWVTDLVSPRAAVGLGAGSAMLVGVALLARWYGDRRAYRGGRAWPWTPPPDWRRAVTLAIITFNPKRTGRMRFSACFTVRRAAVPPTRFADMTVHGQTEKHQGRATTCTGSATQPVEWRPTPLIPLLPWLAKLPWHRLENYRGLTDVGLPPGDYAGIRVRRATVQQATRPADGRSPAQEISSPKGEST